MISQYSEPILCFTVADKLKELHNSVYAGHLTLGGTYIKLQCHIEYKCITPSPKLSYYIYNLSIAILSESLHACMSEAGKRRVKNAHLFIHICNPDGPNISSEQGFEPACPNFKQDESHFW